MWHFNLRLRVNWRAWIDTPFSLSILIWLHASLMLLAFELKLDKKELALDFCFEKRIFLDFFWNGFLFCVWKNPGFRNNTLPAEIIRLCGRFVLLHQAIDHLTRFIQLRKIIFKHVFTLELIQERTTLSQFIVLVENTFE